MLGLEMEGFLKGGACVYVITNEEEDVRARMLTKM